MALILAGIVALSLLTHGRYHNSDASWLITVCEKLLDGKTLYRDILETNPPGAVLLYFPAPYLGKLTGLLPEDWLSLQTYLLGLLSLALAYRMLPDEFAGLLGIRRLFLLLGAFNLFVLPMDAFAQREHFATMLSLPMVASFIRYTETGAWPTMSLRIISLLMAALMLVIKPYFVLPGLFLAIYAAFQAKSWRPLWNSGILLAGLLGVLLTAMSLWIFPRYLTDMWPVVRDLYAPARVKLLTLLIGEGTAAAAILALSVWLMFGGIRRPSPGALIVLLTSLGFLASYLFQGKGFAYQAYSAAFYIFCEYWFLVCRHLAHLAEEPRHFRTLASLHIFIAAAIFGLAAYGLTAPWPAISDDSWAEGIDRPSVMAVSNDPQFVFPLVRRVKADWVGRSSSQWVSVYARHAISLGVAGPNRYSQLDKYRRQDIQSVIATIQNEEPEFVLLDMFPFIDWLRAGLFAACPTLLSNYRPAKSTPNYIIMRRAGPNIQQLCQFQ